jgi:hypothetical protein
MGEWRDGIVCSLANKAVNTKAAIRVLSDLGHGADALVLGRTLIELAVEYLIGGPGTVRLDTYAPQTGG